MAHQGFLFLLFLRKKEKEKNKRTDLDREKVKKWWLRVLVAGAVWLDAFSKESGSKNPNPW